MNDSAQVELFLISRELNVLETIADVLYLLSRYFRTQAERPESRKLKHHST